MPKGGARPGSGPKQQFETRIMLRITDQLLADVDTIRLDGETRSDIIRRALEREIKRCLKIHSRAA